MSIISDYTRNKNHIQIDQWLTSESGTLNAKQRALVDKLKDNVSISKEDETRLTRAQLERLVARYLSNDDVLDEVSKQVDTRVLPVALPDVVAQISRYTDDRIDQEVIDAFTWVMFTQNNKRTGINEELKALTAELKIYGVIQSEINKALSSSSSQTFKTDFNLMDYKLYGYENDAKFREGPEFKLLDQMPKDASGHVSVKTFLESDKKQSGSMTGVENEYKYDKDNNKLGNFATSVSDRSRPLNDQVSEKTTRLNDVSSRYNSAIEALNRFIQKYDSIMRDILAAI
ncbi:virulence-associated V antigen [Aeromonas jandaei]|uniref:virulence-associated V antigen n=1 Tax=Aeromonas jandaei TaxID=650 RepID=UPI003BA0330B